MKNILKFTAALLVAVLAFSLAACKKSGGGGGGAGGGTAYVETGTAVTFDYNDGKSRPLSLVVEEGGSVNKPADPVRDGFEFSGWKTSKDGGTAVTFPYKPTSAVTLFASWAAKTCTITLDYDYDGQTENKIVNYGSDFATPTAPERENYTLFNWTDADGAAVTFPIRVKRDMTFKANWVNTTSVVTVSFELGTSDTANPEPKQLISGAEVTDADVGIFTRSGYDFVGWALSPDATETFELPYTATENVTLYAIWSVQKYTITFRYNDAQRRSTKSAQTFQTFEGAFGEPVTPPATDPTREGYTFIGWYGTAKGGTAIDFDTYKMPSRNADLYAHWEHVDVFTNIFQAEYTYFDPAEQFPGYSGGTTGAGVVTNATEDTANCYVDNDYPTAYGQSTDHVGKYVTYLYKQGLTLRFVINSDKAVSGVTLKLNASIEIATSPVTFSSTGDFGYTVKINGVEQNYTPFTLEPHAPLSGAGMWAGDFSEVTLLTNVSLKEGENVIELITNNSTTLLGGTTAAMAPQVDYIKLENYGDAKLSWKPIYDNLY